MKAALAAFFIYLHMEEKELIKLEKRIRFKMSEIASKTVSLRDSGIGVMINQLKKIDEASYEKIFSEYKKLTSTLKN